MRIPKGKKEYNGIVERSHRREDEEFYIPYIPRLSNYREWRETAMRWLAYYNIKRRHYGRGMGGKAGWVRLRDFYSWINIRIAYFPVLFLDNITTHNFRGRWSTCVRQVHLYL